MTSDLCTCNSREYLVSGAGMKQVLITGGARGIGWGIAEAMLKAGYGVTVTGLTDEELAEIPPRENLSACALDVTCDPQVSYCLSMRTELYALINCAGTILREGKEFTIEGFQKVVDVNLTGTMRMCLAAKPLLDKEGGVIINMASIWSIFGGPLVPAYSASKGAVVQLTKSLAVAWAPDIRVNAIAPGWIATQLTRPAYLDARRSNEILSRTPMKRWGEPDDVAGAAVFLCSTAAKFVTGTVLGVDGGYSAS